MKEYLFIKEWKQEMRERLKIIYPDASKTKIEKFLDKKIQEKLVDRECVIDNNYKKKCVNMTLLHLIDYIKEKKPIIAGNGVLFQQHDISDNPSAYMLSEFMDKRKYFKSFLKVYDETSYEYATYDRLQGSEKINANSFYGANGNAAFIFFNLYVAVSVTSTAQSLISTSMTAFEGFMANNIDFLSLDDCFNLIRNIEREEKTLDDRFLTNKSIDEVIDRLYGMFKSPKPEYKNHIYNYISSLSQAQLNRIYYKNNLYEFTLLPFIKEKMEIVISNVPEFKDPNKIPKEVTKELNELWNYYSEFVHYNHFIYNRIQRLKYDKRKSVVVIDTDSKLFGVA